MQHGDHAEEHFGFAEASEAARALQLESGLMLRASLRRGLTCVACGTMLSPAMGRRRRYLFVCTNERPPGSVKGSCGGKGSNQIFAKLKALLHARGLAEVEVRACRSSCLDVCWGGPIIAVEPDDYFYGAVTEADLPEIVEALANGDRVDRLVVPPEGFTDPGAAASRSST